ncbi:hypothetical protein FXO37_16659 [Capsicum annuum]|nr:hypothetical protein FXO37_16659 [Capsicum annuum]
MANEDSPSSSLSISQIKTKKKRIPASHQVGVFTSDKFDYTEKGFRENRPQHQNDPEKLKEFREDYAVINQESDMHMDDQEELEHMPNSPLNQLLKYHARSWVSLRSLLVLGTVLRLGATSGRDKLVTSDHKLTHKLVPAVSIEQYNDNRHAWKITDKAIRCGLTTVAVDDRLIWLNTVRNPSVRTYDMRHHTAKKSTSQYFECTDSRSCILGFLGEKVMEFDDLGV